MPPQPITIHTAGGVSVELVERSPGGLDGFRWSAKVHGGYECTVNLTGRELSGAPRGNVRRTWSTPQILRGVGLAITRALVSPPGQQPGAAFHVDVTSGDLHNANAWRPCNLGRSSEDGEIDHCLQLDAMDLLAHLEHGGMALEVHTEHLVSQLRAAAPGEGQRPALLWQLALCSVLQEDRAHALARAKECLDLLPPTEMDNLREALWRKWTGQDRS